MAAPPNIPLSTTESAFGRLETNARIYKPLDPVRVSITGRASGDTSCTIRVCDPFQKIYGEYKVRLKNNRGKLRFLAGGPLGAHYIYLIWPGESKHSRYLNFRLDAATAISSGDPDFDGLVPFTREAMLLGRREYEMASGKFTGYISGDTGCLDGIWLRDWIYSLPAYKHWETDMACGLDRFFECQTQSGMIPDGIERSGKTWRVGLESDVEYILVLGVFQTWQATGDDKWLASLMPKLERALAYILNDHKHWDAEHQLVKRQHSCDTWDFDIEGASCAGENRHVIATCDQSGYVFAFNAMALMYRHLGMSDAAARWSEQAAAYRERANKLLWDGVKFQHHVHVAKIDHGNFDERTQLAMGNTWAMTRGLATPEQAQKIIDEYQRRHHATGDAYPWWSLQPGYPDELGYFTRNHCRQGGYANGGLMPWVGGELCRAAFWFGREKYGVQLLRAYAEHLRRTGGSQVWYWPNGEPGFRTINEVRYAGWGMAEWVNALIEGLAGIRDETGQFHNITLEPCWNAVPINNVKTTVRYAASKAYFACAMKFNPKTQTINLDCTGSGNQVLATIPMPDGCVPEKILINAKPIHWHSKKTDQMTEKACFTIPLAGVARVSVICKKK